uniref:Annexin 9 n=1 Tax=Trepomonas sp. PC1 TaxID=1076344 RepID=A0A146K3D7_9EUKA|eukprot:JAP91207.1 Annexin 9 [Trepomonas sp. PC1]
MTQFQMEAQALRTAMKGTGTDEQMIIQVASCRNFLQREQISNSFVALFGLELDQQFQKELSGNFQLLIQHVFKNRHAAWAEMLKNAVSGAGTDNKKLIQLVLLMSDKDIPEISKQYSNLFQQNMAQAITSDLGKNDWNKLIKAWLVGKHQTTYDAQKGADELYKAAKGLGTDEDVFIKILSTATHESYREINQAYTAKYKKYLRDVIKSEFSLNSKLAFCLAHDYMNNPIDAICSTLHKSIDGMGSDDAMLIAVTTLFADYYRGQPIKDAYSQFGDIVKEIKGDTSGYYEKALLAMWGLV